MPVNIQFTPQSYSYTGNQMLCLITSNNLYSAPNVRRDNFKLVIEVQVLVGVATWQTIYNGKTPPNDDGEAYFDVAEILENYINDTRPTIAVILNSGFITNAFAWGINPRYTIYRILAWEEYGIPPTQQGTEEVSSELWAYSGGVSEELHAQTSGYLMSIIGGASDALLTLEPNNKIVADDQHEYRAVFNFTGSDLSIDIEVIATYTDGSTATFIHTTGTILNGQMFIFSAGFNQAVEPYFANAENIKCWEVKAIGGAPFSGQIGRPYKYLREYTTYCCQQKRYLFYLNSLGVPETFSTKAKWRRKLNVERDFCVSMPSQTYLPAAHRKFQHHIYPKHLYIANAGYMSRVWKLSAEQLLLAMQVALLAKNYDGENYAYPVVIISEKFDVTDNFEELHELSFELEPSQQLLAYDDLTL